MGRPMTILYSRTIDGKKWSIITDLRFHSRKEALSIARSRRQHWRMPQRAVFINKEMGWGVYQTFDKIMGLNQATR